MRASAGSQDNQAPRGVFFALIVVIVAATRLCHSKLLWADDDLPLAAAMQLLRGKALYRDVWFDKPPLTAWVYLLWGARPGVWLRLAGAAYVVAVAAVAWRFARARWGVREGLFAASFAAFFLTFGLPSAVIPLASDMLLILPHFAAAYFAWRGRAWWSGVAAGVGLLCSSKALFVLAACSVWLYSLRQWRQMLVLLAGFAAPNAMALGWMELHGSASDFYRQVWQWGQMYASGTFIAHPFIEGLKRSANWIGFQAALAAGAAIALARERYWRTYLWIALSFTGVVLGLRFFPRYYFLLLPPMTIAAARGWSLVSRSRMAMLALTVLLAIPLARFGPRYISLARGETWTEQDMDRDSREASAKLRALAGPGDTLFVWGYRPDIFIDSGLPPGTRFLESQPISGVLADRHFFSSRPSAPAALTAPNREELLASRPTWVVDGLGVFNPTMALARQSALGAWFEQYAEIGRTGLSILYRVQ